MRELSAAILKKLNLKAAAEAESEHWRNLLPEEPWRESVRDEPGSYAKWVEVRLKAGKRNAPGFMVDVRKAHQAFRPVPVVGVGERIIYRALTDWVLSEMEPPKRSREDYLRFVSGPINSAFSETGSVRISDANVEYVVQADIASFYQYVDHGVLLEELENRTGKVEESRLLVELLGEMQGSTFGLPQLLEPSDRLSEIYIEILERDVIRRVGHCWRYNDDFRLAVNGYGNAQQALEELSAAARPLGLTLNDRKSSILKFSTYFWRNVLGNAGDGDVEFDPTKLEALVQEYPDLDGEGLLGTARATLDRLEVGVENHIDPAKASSEDVKELRQAFSILSREKSPMGLTHVVALFRFIPQLTPRLADYLVALHEAGVPTQNTWDAVVNYADAYNVWQRAWLTYVARRCEYFDTERLEWIRKQYQDAPPGLLHAEAALTLAVAGKMNFLDLDTALRTQPEALAPWYALGIDHVGPTADQRNAVRASSRLYDLLIDPPTGK